MAADDTKYNLELETLFRKYESAPDSYVFAPLADAYRKAGMLEEAVEICRKGIRRHPEYPSGHVVHGKCHFDVGKLDEAEASFHRVLELDADNLVALKYLGMIQAGRGDLARAGDYFEKILALDPENREITGMLEDLQAVEGSRPDARSRSAHKAASDAPEPSGAEPEDDFEGEPIYLGGEEGVSDELATTTLADIYAAQGYHDKAARIYREVLRRQPRNDAIRRKLAQVERDAGAAGSGGDEPEPATPDTPDRSESPRGAGDPTRERSAGSARRRKRAEDAPEPVVAARPSTPPGGAGGAEPDQTETGRTLDEQKSYEQFKRWLENMQR